MGIGILTIFALIPRASIPARAISSPAGRERRSPGISGTGWSVRTVSPAFMAPAATASETSSAGPRAHTNALTRFFR